MARSRGSTPAVARLSSRSPTGLHGQDTVLLQGFYRIEVVEPKGVTSNEASYGMEPCTAPLDESGAFHREADYVYLR
jgi:hypothetical protein